MEKCNFVIHQCRKFEFEDLYHKKIKSFLNENFEQYRKADAWHSASGYTTKDRELLLRFIKGLKALDFEKFDYNKLEWGWKSWQPSTSTETKLMEEENIITYVWKGLTATKKLAMAIYVSIGEQDGEFIVETSGCATFWTNKGGKQWKEIDISGSHTHSPSSAKHWSHTINGVSSRRNIIKHKNKSWEKS